MRNEIFGGNDRMRAAATVVSPSWLGRYLDSLAVLPAADRSALYTPDYRAELSALEPVIPEQALLSLRTGPGSPLRRICEFEVRYRLPAYHLRRVDHLSMAHSVEVRLPFGQRRVVEAARALPDELRISDGTVKRTLHAAASGLLPAAVLSRPKQPFTLPVASMLVPGSPLWDFAQDTLASANLSAERQLDTQAVRRLFTDQASRPTQTTALTIWALMVYQVWREQFRPGSQVLDATAEAIIA